MVRSVRVQTSDVCVFIVALADHVKHPDQSFTSLRCSRCQVGALRGKCGSRQQKVGCTTGTEQRLPPRRPAGSYALALVPARGFAVRSEPSVRMRRMNSSVVQTCESAAARASSASRPRNASRMR